MLCGVESKSIDSYTYAVLARALRKRIKEALAKQEARALKHEELHGDTDDLEFMPRNRAASPL